MEQGSNRDMFVDLEEPALNAYQTFILESFFDLSSCRGFTGSMSGMFSLALSFQEIDAYAWRYGIVDIDEFHNFKHLIKICDSTYLKIEHDKLAREQKKASNNGRR